MSRQEESWKIPRSLLTRVAGAVCRGEVQALTPLAGGGLNEAYLVEVAGRPPLVLRATRGPAPWFTGEADAGRRARAAGIPAPEIVGVEHLEVDGGVVSVSLQRFAAGRSLRDLAPGLPVADVTRIVEAAGAMLARLHRLAPGEVEAPCLAAPDDEGAARAAAAAGRVVGPAAADLVHRGVAWLRRRLAEGPPPGGCLVHGDWLPKHLLVDDRGEIVAVIDWEFSGAGSPAYDLAHWEAAAGAGLEGYSGALRRGYARVAGSDAGGGIPVFTVFFALDTLAWRNPATDARIRRCVGIIGGAIERRQRSRPRVGDRPRAGG